MSSLIPRTSRSPQAGHKPEMDLRLRRKRRYYFIPRDWGQRHAADGHRLVLQTIAGSFQKSPKFRSVHRRTSIARRASRETAILRKC